MEKNLKVIMISFILGVITVIPIQAQNDFKIVLDKILSNNQHLKTAQKEADRLKTESRIGLTPDDPELEYGYMWGSPTATGNKKDFSISQSLSFPTVYASRIKLARLKTSIADHFYLRVKQRVIGEALSLMVELVYQNNRLELLEKRLQASEKISQMTKRMLENGEVGLLEQDKADLQHMKLQNEYTLCGNVIDKLEVKLTALNGNHPLKISANSYPSFLRIVDKDELKQAYTHQHTMILIAQSEIDIRRQEVKLTKNEYWPDFSLAYVSESTLGQNLKGFRVGLRIPLWSKSNTVNHAKIALDQQESQFLDLRQQNMAEWNHLLLDYETKNKRLNKMKVIMDRIIPNKGLLMAFDLGEMSLMEYITETTFFYDSQDSYLDLERDKYLSAAEMLKVELAK